MIPLVGGSGLEMTVKVLIKVFDRIPNMAIFGG